MVCSVVGGGCPILLECPRRVTRNESYNQEEQKMWWNKSLIYVSLVVFVLSGIVFAECPSADLTGDCFVDFEDFAVMASQWLTGVPNIPDDMVYIPDGEFVMGNHFSAEVMGTSFFAAKSSVPSIKSLAFLDDSPPNAKGST